MREIIFRGKDVNGTHEWRTGYFCTLVQGSLKVIGNGVDWCQVYSETVGQYTGLTDKNGTKIFEGDIVMHIQKHKISGKVKSIAVIKWDEAYSCYSVEYTNDRITAFLGTEHHRLEVIGNIHDNPELLEE